MEFPQLKPDSYGAKVLDFVYTPAGNRVRKTFKDNVRTYTDRLYIYNGAGSLVEEFDIKSNRLETIHAGNIRILDNRVEYDFRDMLSSTVLISDAAGKTLQRYRYDPFGEIEQAKGNSDNRFLFNGKEADESGLSYYGARYYNSITGRWISRDPNVGSIFKPDGLNRFLFCYNNPIKKIDKNGEEAQPVSLYSGQTSYLNSVVLQPYIPHTEPLTPEDIAKLPVNYKELYDRPNFILIGLNKDKDSGEIYPLYLDKGGARSVLDPISETILLGAAFKIAGNINGYFKAANAGTEIIVRGPLGKYNIGAHTLKRMSERGITENMMEKALLKGQMFWDPKNKVVNYVLENGFASGKDLLVGVNPITSKITTVIRGSGLINTRFISLPKP